MKETRYQIACYENDKQECQQLVYDIKKLKDKSVIDIVKIALQEYKNRLEVGI